MANKPQTFTVTPQQYVTIEAEINAAGVPISGDSGTAEHDDVKMGWTYDGTTLSITVLSAPPFFTGLAEARIKAAIESALAASGD